MGIWHQEKNKFSLRTKRIKMNISGFFLLLLLVFFFFFFLLSVFLVFFFSLISLMRKTSGIRNKICWWLKLIPLTSHNLQFLLFRSISFIHSFVRSFVPSFIYFNYVFFILGGNNVRDSCTPDGIFKELRDIVLELWMCCVERVLVSSIVARGKTHPKANISVGDFNKIRKSVNEKLKKIQKTVYGFFFFLIIILFKLLRSDKSFALAQTQFTLIAQA